MPSLLDNIVISGVAGRMPQSKNLEDFMKNLLNGVNFVNDQHQRWNKNAYDVPYSMSTIDKSILEDIDAPFFNMSPLQGKFMDPQLRMLLECAHEAIIDAGINPRDFRGSRTGVYVGAFASDMEKYVMREPRDYCSAIVTGCQTYAFSNRLSFQYDLKGPSLTINTACSSSMYALGVAFADIYEGRCDAALVGGVSVVLDPKVTMIYNETGLLSETGACRTFSADADGFVRGEGCGVILLQKKSAARRHYASLLNVTLNADGWKKEGLIHPKRDIQYNLLHETYKNISVHANDVCYIETHGPGSKAGDPEEVAALDEFFCKDRKAPLLIGSIKSNIGHTEAASGIFGLIKVVLAMEAGIIPANLHLKEVNPILEAIIDGRIKVVAENTPWNGGIVGVSSFGVGGANGHAVLKSHTSSKTQYTKEQLPRLIVLSGRTYNGIERILSIVESHADDAEYLALVNEVYCKHIPQNTYRGYALMGGEKSQRGIDSVAGEMGVKRPIWFIYSGMGCQWTTMGRSLLEIEVCRNSLNRCAEALKQFNVDLIDIITTDQEAVLSKVLNPFIAISAVQIALTDLLTLLGITPDGFFGHSFGELVCSYADGCLTLEQTILLSYWRGYCFEASRMESMSMAAVGLSWEDCEKRKPSDVELVCNNGAENVTIGGPTDSIKQFINTLTKEGIFAREVDSVGLVSHCHYADSMCKDLLEHFRKVIPHPKERSSRWISTSVPESQWNSPISKYCSAEYHTHNSRVPVLFYEATKNIPKNAICIEVAPHGLFQSILKKSVSQETTNIGLMKRNVTDVSLLLESIGKLYIAGGPTDISKLYPPINYPVGRGTPMLSQLADWDHSHRFPIPNIGEIDRAGEITVEIDLAKNDAFISGHTIDGRVLYPATGYIVLAWEALAQMMQTKFDRLPVVVEDVVFHRATIMPIEGSVKFRVNILDNSGRFEICEGETLVVSGKIYAPEDLDSEFRNLDKYPVESSGLELDSDAIYKECRLRGYEYRGKFRGMLSTDSSGATSKLQWENNWISFLDTMLHCAIIRVGGFSLPTTIGKMVIDPIKHLETVAKFNSTNIPCKMLKKSIKTIFCGGVQIYGLDVSPSVKKPSEPTSMERYSFVPYINLEESDNALAVCFQICKDNSFGNLKYKIADIANHISANRVLAPLLQEAVEQEPQRTSNITVYTTQPTETFQQITSQTDIPIINQDIVNGPVDQGCDLIVGYDVVRNVQGQVILSNMLGSVHENGFILLEETVVDYDCQRSNNLFSSLNLILVSVQRKGDTFLILLRAATDVISRKKKIIHITEANFNWLNELQKALGEAEKSNEYLYIVSQGEPLSGAVGFVNCLRYEKGGKFARLIFIQDSQYEPFSFGSKIYVDQLRKDLVINVLRRNTWGSFRHSKFDKVLDVPLVEVEHAFIDTTIPNDLSSLRWIQGPFSKEMPSHKPGITEMCTVYYTGMNFKDVVLASGQILPDVMSGDLAAKESYLGYEFAGRDSNGRRVFGCRIGDCFATTVEANCKLLWPIPDKWTMPQAAGLPVVYCTVYSAFFQLAKLQKGESILIHAGSGGVGQAAISVALHHGIKVYTTVGSKDKKEFVQKIFPELTDDRFGYSRDTSFEQFINEVTDGEGVDVVLNYSSDDKLLASFRCLKPNGRFVQIGKIGYNKDRLEISSFGKNITFFGLFLDIMVIENRKNIDEVSAMFAEGLKNGAVRPINSTIFTDDKIEDAFRFIAAGKHLGKVIIKIRDEEDITGPYIPTPILKKAVPRTYLYKKKSYILTGGLGGFGLEVADWLVSRGAQNLILTSRTGIKTSYQSLKVKRWTERGIRVHIDTNDITTEAGVRRLLTEANKLGPVGGIFNFAGVIRDSLFEDQTENDFKIVCAPKVDGTKHLDTLSRDLCRELDYFVCFSSVACGRGNISQTNYGMANSVMERICEQRCADGLPGTAIQWGAIGDTGIIIESLGTNDTIVGGTRPQRMSSCLEALNLCLLSPQPVLSSMVLAEKMKTARSKSASLVKIVANILGIWDIKNISEKANLSSLGVDSLMLIEIKQILERNYDCILASPEIRKLTMEDLRALESEPVVSQSEQQSVIDITFGEGVNVYFSNELIPTECLVHLNSHISKSTERPLFICSPGDNSVTALKAFANKLQRPVWALRSTKDIQCEQASELASIFLKKMKTVQPDGPYNVAGYSNGALVAYEIVVKLEQEGQTAHLIALDGAPEYVKLITMKYLQNLSDAELNSLAISYFGAQFANLELKEIVKLLSELDFESQIIKMAEMIHDITKDPIEQLQDTIKAFHMRITMVRKYQLNSSKIRAPVTLLKATENSIDLPEDYGLSKICEKQAEIFYIDGDHITFLTNDKSASKVAKIVESKVAS